MKTAVIGIGNPLRKDDGIGIILVEKLREEKLSNIVCIDAGTGGIQLLPILSNYDRIIIVDAVQFKAKPGETKIFRLDEIKVDRGKNLLSIHMMNVIQVIQLYEKLEDKTLDITIFGIKPYDTSPGTKLSPLLKEKLVEIKEKLIGVIR